MGYRLRITGGEGGPGREGRERRTMGNSPDRIILNAPDTVHILGKLYKWYDTAQLEIVIYAGRLILVKLHWSGLDRKGNSAVGSPAPPPTPVPRIPDVRLRCPRVPPLTLYMTCTCKCGGKLGNHPLQWVLRIRDVYPGSRILMFTLPGPRISDPGSKNRNKRESWIKISCNTFLCSHKFHKIVCKLF